MTEQENEMNQREGEPATLEEMFDSLEILVKRLETENISLEESFGLYHEGMLLLKKCNESIDAVEKKVQVLDEDGETYDF